MKSYFVIKDLISNEYWYGWYSNKHWTNTVTDAKLFATKQEAREWIVSIRNEDEFKNKTLTIIKIYNIK